MFIHKHADLNNKVYVWEIEIKRIIYQMYNLNYIKRETHPVLW